MYFSVTSFSPKQSLLDRPRRLSHFLWHFQLLVCVEEAASSEFLDEVAHWGLSATGDKIAEVLFTESAGFGYR